MPAKDPNMFKYKHALALYPYFKDSARLVRRLFPPTGLEYIARVEGRGQDKPQKWK